MTDEELIDKVSEYLRLRGLSIQDQFCAWIQERAAWWITSEIEKVREDVAAFIAGLRDTDDDQDDDE